jgi:hypothetical protein
MAALRPHPRALFAQTSLGYEPKEQAERSTTYFLLTDGLLQTGKHPSRLNPNERIDLKSPLETDQPGSCNEPTCDYFAATLYCILTC